jgi:PAS domain S-box-containing protein
MVQTLDLLETDDPQLNELLGSVFGLHQLLESFPDYVSCLDRSCRIVLVNRVSEELAGIPILGMPSGMFVPPLRRREYEQLCRRVLERGTVETFEFVSPRSLFTYQSRMAPLRTPSGEVVGIVATTTDVTEWRRAMRRADDALRIEREATRQLRELDELKNEFVAKVAHDLRTPITTIQGFADTMVHRWSAFSDEDKLRFLDLISQGSRQLMVLVEDILEVSNIESAEFRIELGDVDLTKPLRMLAAHFDVITAPGRILWDVPDDLPHVRGDERRITQIVTNLVSNALKFSDDDSVVRVSARARDDGSHVRLRIGDEGVGIAPDDLPRLFGKFVQLNQPRDRPYPGGSGLGLYITRSLVEAQGGTVWIESELGVGTTVFVDLPVA